LKKISALKKKSKWYFNFKRSRDGVSLEFKAIEGSFGAINRKFVNVVYLWGYSLKDR
jgi:hypothetical protein